MENANANFFPLTFWPAAKMLNANFFPLTFWPAAFRDGTPLFLQEKIGPKTVLLGKK